MSDEHQRRQKADPNARPAGAEPDEDTSTAAPVSGASYTAPVAGLLAIGDPRTEGAEARVAALGLGQAHVPELVRMAVDPELNEAPGDSLEVWAPLHALRALKGFDASAHAAELIPLVELHEDDWFREELPGVFAQIGQAALAPLQAYLADRAHSEWGHSLVAHALGAIGQQHAALRAEVVVLLSAVLQHAEQYDELACSFAMDALVELEAVEALPAIRHAFELDKIDPMVRGPWDAIVDEIGGEIDPDDPLIARSRQRDAERQERFFPRHLRRQLNPALGIEQESPFARLVRQKFGASGMPGESPVNPTALQHTEAQARKERQRRAQAQARKQKQKRKAASDSRKTNRKKRK
ncbi:MAG: hypothetical protein HC822_03915 [Oscillochloris sp.]|nr:hypothetical protein [Oscillochloris sp.]